MPNYLANKKELLMKYILQHVTAAVLMSSKEEGHIYHV